VQALQNEHHHLLLCSYTNNTTTTTTAVTAATTIATAATTTTRSEQELKVQFLYALKGLMTNVANKNKCQFDIATILQCAKGLEMNNTY